MERGIGGVIVGEGRVDGMSSRSASQPPGSEITPESLYLRRREFIKNGVLAAGTAAVVGSGLLWLIGNGPPPDAPEEQAPVQTAAQPPAPAAAQSGQPAAQQPALAATVPAAQPIQAAAPPKTGPYTVDEPLTSLK